MHIATTSHSPQLATRFARKTFVQRSETPLAEDQMRAAAPSVFAEGKHASRSERYTYIPTIGQAFPLDLFELRAVDVTIRDEMLQCLDALRWAHADLHTLVPDGDRRMLAVIARWGLRWPESE